MTYNPNWPTNSLSFTMTLGCPIPMKHKRAEKIKWSRDCHGIKTYCWFNLIHLDSRNSINFSHWSELASSSFQLGRYPWVRAVSLGILFLWFVKVNQLNQPKQPYHWHQKTLLWRYFHQIGKPQPKRRPNSSSAASRSKASTCQDSRGFHPAPCRRDDSTKFNQLISEPDTKVQEIRGEKKRKNSRVGLPCQSFRGVSKIQGGTDSLLSQHLQHQPTTSSHS